MSIRYFTKWLQDEEKSFATWENTWAWLDLNVTDPPPGVIYLNPKPFVLNGGATEETPLLVGQGGNFELSPASVDGVDGGSASFIIRRSTLYIFNFTPLVIFVLGIITNAIQLAICCRLRRKLPAVSFIATIALADLVCITLGAGRMAIDRLFMTSLDHLHPWSCKIRHFLLASAFDLSSWLVPLGLCELWRPASRLIIYATIVSLLLNLHNLVTRGWQVQGDFGQKPILNDCGFSFPDARIFWLHVHPIVSVIINVIGPILAAVLLIMTLSFQGRCHPIGSVKKLDSKSHSNKKPVKMLRINLLVLFALLAIVQAILLAPTAVLSAMELFLNTTVHPSMRALVFFGQLVNCVIKLPLIFLAAPQLCPAMTESTMGFYGEKHPKKVKNKQPKLQKAISHASESDLADQSGLEDHNSLVNGGRHNNNNNSSYPIYQNNAEFSSSSGRKKKTKKHNERKYEEVIAIDPNAGADNRDEAQQIDAGKQLAQATLSRNTNNINGNNVARPPPPPPQTLSLISTDHFYQTNTNRHHNHHHYHQQPAISSSGAILQNNNNNQLLFPIANNGGTSHRLASLVTTNSNNISSSANGGTSLTAAALNALGGASGSTLLPPPPHFIQQQQQPQQQLYWLNDGVIGGGKPASSTSDSGGRKIYV